MSDSLINQMRALNLPGMASRLEALLSTPDYAQMNKEAVLEELLGAQRDYVHAKRYEGLHRRAKLKHTDAAIELLDYDGDRGLDHEVMATLTKCDWVARGQHVIITGAAGTGKSFVACSLGHECVRHELSVRYMRLNAMLEDYMIARGTGTLPKLRRALDRAKLLIIDDFGLSPITTQGVDDLFSMLDDRPDDSAVIITSQLPVKHWHEYLGNPMSADAVLDRLLSHAHFIKLQGDSMRKRYSRLMEEE